MAYDWRKEEYEVTRPGRTRIDYRQEIGRAHVPIGVERGFTVVDRDRYEVAFSGGELEPFDENLLARMRTVPPRWRKA